MHGSHFCTLLPLWGLSWLPLRPEMMRLFFFLKVKSYFCSMCFCLWKYDYVVLPCKSTNWLCSQLHSEELLNSPTVLFFEPFSPLKHFVSASAKYAFENYTDVNSFKTCFILRRICHWDLSMWKGLLGTKEEMGELIIYAKNISCYVKFTCEEQWLSLSCPENFDQLSLLLVKIQSCL